MHKTETYGEISGNTVYLRLYIKLLFPFYSLDNTVYFCSPLFSNLEHLRLNRMQIKDSVFDVKVAV